MPHYPQHEAFLDACDELGLMVWEETPGWGYVGADKEFEDQVLQNVCDMVRRDRNHASIIIWVYESTSHTTIRCTSRRQRLPRSSMIRGLTPAR